MLLRSEMDSLAILGLEIVYQQVSPLKITRLKSPVQRGHSWKGSAILVE